MLHFCRDYFYYATVEVLEPHSHRFLASLDQAKTVDEVLQSHETLLGTCLRELLLTERDALYRSLAKLFRTCVLFCHNLQSWLDRFSKTPTDSDGRVLES